MPALFTHRHNSLLQDCRLRSTSLLVLLLCLLPGRYLYAQEFKADVRGTAAVLRMWMPKQPPDALDSIKKENLFRQGTLLQWTYPDSAMTLFNRLFQQSIASGNYYFASLSKISMGLVAMGQGDFHSCFSYYKEAYHYIRTSGNDRKLLPKLFVNIGVTYFVQENYEKAIEYYSAIIQYMQQVMPEDRNMVMAYSNIADVLIHMDQYDNAAYYLDLAETLMLKKKKLESIYGYVWINKSEVALMRKDYKACEAYSAKALANGLKSGNEELLQSCYIIRTRLYLALHQPEKAIPYQSRALRSPSNAAYPFYSIVAPYYTLADAYYQAGDFKNAELALFIALDKAESSGILSGKLKALNTLVSIYENTGRYQEALAQQHVANALRDSIQNRESLRIAGELEARFRSEQKDKQIAQKEFLIEKQQRDIEHKNTQIVAVVTGLGIILILVIAGYRNFRNRTKITTLKAKMEGEEIERSRIAKELHDGIGGMLAVLKMKLSLDRSQAAPEVVALLNETAVQVRKTAHNLMPDAISNFSLKEILTSYIGSINQSLQQNFIELQVNSQIRINDPSVKLSLYRMLQEVIQNTIKHARASMVNIQIFERNSKLNILIEDDGIGFDMKEVKKGLGLTNLEARTRLLGGKIHISSSPGRGTTTSMEFPFS